MSRKKVLFLHGMFGQNSSKPDFFRSLGFEVVSPTLDDWNFSNAVDVSQEYYNKHGPDVVVGSSRGGAVAININSTDTPLLLLAPAWCYFGNCNKTKSNSIIVHSKNDLLVPYQKSLELSEVSNCELIEAGEGHRLNCEKSRSVIKKAVNKLINN